MNFPLGDKELRIGILGMTEGNGHPYSWSAMFNGYNKEAMEDCGFPVIPRYLEKQPKETFGVRGAKVTHVWCDDPENAKKVAKASLIPNILEKPEDCIGHVDAVIIGTDQGWDHVERAEKFIEAGLPVFIDKPLVGNLKDARKLVELVNAGAKILGSSALRYCYEVQNVHASLEENNAKILHVNVSVGTNEYDYAIHAYEMICALLKDRPVDARYMGTASIDGHACDSYFFNFACGATAVINNVTPKHTNFHTTILTDVRAADACFTVDASKLYEAMLKEVCSELEGKENLLAPIADQMIPVKAALACKASKLAGGKTISLDDPCLEDVAFDGYAFEESYGAAAAKSYLNP